jgi:hypothetical protein
MNRLETRSLSKNPRKKSICRNSARSEIGASRPIHLAWMERHDGELGRAGSPAITPPSTLRGWFAEMGGAPHSAGAPIPRKHCRLRRFATRAIFAALKLPLHPLKADGGDGRLALGELANHLSLHPRKADGGGDAPAVDRALGAAPPGRSSDLPTTDFRAGRFRFLEILYKYDLMVFS